MDTILRPAALSAALLAAGPGPAPDLRATIAALDAAVFDAYNRCDLEKLGSYFAEDLEFYHDQGGLTRSRQSLVDAVKNNICGKVRLHHHPGRDDVEPVGEAKFVHLWQNKDGAWIITRVISYDHRARPR